MICHGIPDDRVIEDGDIVNLDVTVYVFGVHADLNETFFIGDVDADSRMLVRTAFDCLKNAVDMGASTCHDGRLCAGALRHGLARECSS